jgi:hypothetical protein
MCLPNTRSLCDYLLATIAVISLPGFPRRPEQNARLSGSQTADRVGRRGWTRTSDPQLRRLMLYPPELRARIVFNDIRGQFLHAIDRSTLFETTVAISVVRDHHLHYMFAQHRHQLSTLNWLIRVGRLQERPDLRLNRPVDSNSSPRQRVQSCQCSLGRRVLRSEKV